MAETKNETGKRKKPTFVVRESKFSARVKVRWRYPRGKHSPIRQKHKGRPPMPSPGYGSPTPGLDAEGRESVVISSLGSLENLDSKKYVLVIASTVGKRKKLDLLQAAKEKDFSVANFKDIDAAIKLISESFQSRKKQKEEKSKVKGKKHEEKKKKAEEKTKKEAEEKSDKSHTHEDNKQKDETEKKLAEKTITKKQ